MVLDALSQHLTSYPAEGLVFTNASGSPLRRSAFGTAWRRATTTAGLPGMRFHDLRHYYASLLIHHGVSVRTVQARLGHASAAETLDTYSHLWPASDDQTRQAVDEVLGATVRSAAPRPPLRVNQSAGQPNNVPVAWDRCRGLCGCTISARIHAPEADKICASSGAASAIVQTDPLDARSFSP